MNGWTVEIPGPAPALNTTYKVVVTKNALGKPVTRLAKHGAVATWQDAAAWLVKAARPKGWQPGRRVLVTIEWYSPRKRDCDAGVKAALDAVAVGLGIDDGCFLLSVPVNEIDKANPRTLLRIENVE
jgi:Holliday junction resolvase RusA-like endonuclease